jgi:hypothetical protein
MMARTSGSRYGEQVQDAVFAAGIGESLRVNKALIESRIDAEIHAVNY